MPDLILFRKAEEGDHEVVEEAGFVEIVKAPSLFFVRSARGPSLLHRRSAVPLLREERRRI